MADESVIIVDDQGTEHEFPAGFDPKRAASIVRNTPKQAASSADLTHGGRVYTDAHPLSDDPAAGDSVVTQMNDAIKPLAHPSSVGDMLNLIALPGAAEDTSIVNAGRAAVKATKDAWNSSHGFGVLKVPFQAAANVIPEFRKSYADKASEATNAMPLQEQMDRNLLPERPAPVRTRTGDAPYRPETEGTQNTAGVLDTLPNRPAPQRGRFGEAPYQPTGQRTLAEMVADDELGPTRIVNRGRSPEPPLRPSPSHDTVAPTPGGSAGGATGMTPGANSNVARPGALSPADRAGLRKQGYSDATIDKIEQQAGSATPVSDFQDIMGQKGATITPEHPQRQPRIADGAKRVLQPGQTVDQVRALTGPVLNEPVGAASPILPRNILGDIVDKIKSIPPGPERDAYVARAMDGKTMPQVENIRRTLEHLGLIGVAAAAPALRQSIMNQIRMMPSHTPVDTNQ